MKPCKFLLPVFAALGVAASAHATSIFVNFGNLANASGTGGNPFLNTTVNPVNASFANLVDSTNAATGIGFAIIDGFNSSFPGNTNGGVNSVSGAAAAAGFTGDMNSNFFLLSDGPFNGITDATASMRFTGLNLSTNYTISVLSSRATGTSRQSVFSFVGATSPASTTITSNNNSSVLATYTGLSDAFGNLTINVSIGNTQGAGNNFAYVNAVELQFTAIPEPSVYGMIIVAALAVAVVHRRRSNRIA